MIKLLTLALVFSSMSSFASNPSDICANDRIIDSSGDAGRVIEVFSNGKAKIKFDAFTGFYTKSLSGLGKGVKCHAGFCASNRVIDTSGDAGTIIEVFNNGTAKVKFDAFTGKYTKNLRGLGRGYECVGNACAGDRVIDSNGNTGTIKEVFNNGTAKVKLDRFTGTYHKSLRSLGYGEDCSNTQRCPGRNHRQFLIHRLGLKTWAFLFLAGDL